MTRTYASMMMKMMHMCRMCMRRYAHLNCLSAS